MRPISFIILILIFRSGCLPAQLPLNVALRLPSFAAAPSPSDGIGWMLFSRQYHCVSNWNASGLALTRMMGAGESAVIIYRDGIPGFSWYHLYLSHNQQFSKFSSLVQLRFSVIALSGRKPVFRLGGNLQATCVLGSSLKLETTVYDFPGWLFPAAPVARGDPALQFLLFHEPGRLISMAGGFGMSRRHFGPVTAGVRMRVQETVEITGFFDVLPFGVSLGVGWRVKGFEVRVRVEQRGGVGVTPMAEVGRR